MTGVIHSGTLRGNEILNLTNLDQHVTEMMIITGNKCYSVPVSGFLIIPQNANMVVNGKVN